MVYDDSGRRPATWRDYEDRARSRAEASMTGADSRAVLKEAGERGYSKLGAAEAKERARAHVSEWERRVRSKVVRWRWPVAHGLRLAYAELEAVERRAGVVPVEREDAVHVRLTVADDADRAAADAVLAALAERFGAGEPSGYGRREGGTNIYLDVLVPADT